MILLTKICTRFKFGIRISLKGLQSSARHTFPSRPCTYPNPRLHSRWRGFHWPPWFSRGPGGKHGAARAAREDGRGGGKLKKGAFSVPFPCVFARKPWPRRLSVVVTATELFGFRPLKKKKRLDAEMQRIYLKLAMTPWSSNEPSPLKCFHFFRFSRPC